VACPEAHEKRKGSIHHCDSAQQHVKKYKRDLNARAAKHVNSELEKLKIPTRPSRMNS
jgi:hypothetical protein